VVDCAALSSDRSKADSSEHPLPVRSPGGSQLLAAQQCMMGEGVVWMKAACLALYRSGSTGG